MHTDPISHHQEQILNLKEELRGNTQKLKVKKKTISNLFRYETRKNIKTRSIDLSGFNQILNLDSKNLVLEVQGLTTFEQIVDYTLKRGFLPLITPELKHITVGGATVGIGIETNSYRYGFVHNSIIEADVLLSNGNVLTCTKTNKYSDLLRALPNSYGTLGYVLRVKMKLRSAKKYMILSTKKFESTKSLLAELKKEVKNEKNDSVESLAYSKNELYLTTVRQTNNPINLKSIYGAAIFYKEISKTGIFTLKTHDFMFRYDPEWFWNIPESPFFNFVRRIIPKSMRNSSFYTRNAKYTELPFIKQINSDMEQLIQDWEVPFKNADKLLNFVLDNVELDNKPLMVALINIPEKATIYPIKTRELYLNLGSYSFVKKKLNKSPFYNTKMIDKFCFALGGIKMLYSSTFMPEKEFNRIYNGQAYKKIKKKYDPLGLFPTLFEKAVKGI